MIFLWWTLVGMAGMIWEISLSYRGRTGTPSDQLMTRRALHDQPLLSFLIVAIGGFLLGPITPAYLVWRNRRNVKELFR